MKLAYQIRSFELVYNLYDGKLPLHRFLFAYFKQHKQMGSSDRRWVTRYLYSFFRLGKALQSEPQLLRLAIADFLCNETSSLVVEHYLPELAGHMMLPVNAKIALIEEKFPAFKLDAVFPFKAELSAEMIKADFYSSFFIQPDLFIRVQPSIHQNIVDQVVQHGSNVKEISETTLAFPNGTKLEKLIDADVNYQVQDLSSQKTGAYYKPAPYDYWWDCCAASGGKSLLLHASEPKIQLLVSDIRPNSLHNLDERFRLAGLKKYQKKELDLLQNNEQEMHDYAFDGILLDAPCSGSGTWGRTPEMLFFFEEQKVAYFSKLQRGIAANVVKYLKAGKPLIYMTCSVFKEENEDVIEHLLNTLPLKLESMETIIGYHNRADTMFVARLIKS